MKKRIKKGFTLVELLVVIAILAVLSTVAIVGYNSFTEKARISNDKTLVTQLNKLLLADETTDGKAKFASDALEVVAENGFDVKKMTPTTDNFDIVWNEESNRFVLLDDEGNEVIETLSASAHKNWQFSSDVTPVKEGFSIYLNDEFEGTEVTVTSGLDVGNNSLEVINYTTNDTEEVTFVTNGGTLNIDAPNATVNHHGSAKVVNVNDVASSTYNVYAEVQFIKVADGEHVVLKDGSNVNAVYVAGNNKNVEVQNGQTGNVYTAADGTEEEIKTSGTLFAGGLGTEASPYLIENVEQLANIGVMYEKGFYSYKVADGIETLDLSNWTTINLNGNFDGNGVKLLNVTSRLFGSVGKYENKDITLKNFEVTMNLVSSSNASTIKQISNFGNTTFENVKIHGYIEGESNVASLYSFGTKNGSASGSNYVVEFKNVLSDATIVCTTKQPVGALIAHAFAGDNNKLTLKVDSNSKYIGTIYTAGTAANSINEFIAIGAYEILVNGETYTQKNYASSQIQKIVPNKTDEGYKVSIANNVSKVIVSITGQLTAYDANNEKISTSSGITMTLSTVEYNENLGTELKVLDLFSSVEINNGANSENAAVVGGVLTLDIAREVTYKTGNIKIQVNQYDDRGNLLGVGTLEVAATESESFDWIVR